MTSAVASTGSEPLGLADLNIDPKTLCLMKPTKDEDLKACEEHCEELRAPCVLTCEWKWDGTRCLLYQDCDENMSDKCLDIPEFDAETSSR